MQGNLPKSKYRYTCVCVRFWQEKYFPLKDIREAVELLRCADDTKSTGLLVEVDIDDPRCIPLIAWPVIPFKEIEGKTLKQLFELFDARVDAIVEKWNKKADDENNKHVGA